MKKKHIVGILILVLVFIFVSCTMVNISNKNLDVIETAGDEVSNDQQMPPIDEVELAPIAPEKPVSNETPVHELLNQLAVDDTVSTPAYNRDLFNHWVRGNDTGCDTRFAVLVVESLVSVTADGCKVVSGSWVSIYDNIQVTDASSLDIDHMIPLAEAWRSGAHNWDEGSREAFANDLEFPASLIAVTASSNRSKGDRDPAEWLPDVDQCGYVTNWVLVKHRWNLSVDSAEKNSIVSVLDGCAVGDSVTAPPKVEVKPAPNVSVPPVVVTPPVAGATHPQFSSCKEAKANGYKGPYIQGQNVEYDWYRDGDKDGMVCE